LEGGPGRTFRRETATAKQRLAKVNAPYGGGGSVGLTCAGVGAGEGAGVWAYMRKGEMRGWRGH